MPLKLLRATQSWPGHKVIFLMECYGVDRRCGVAEVKGVAELLGSTELSGDPELKWRSGVEVEIWS